MENEWEVVENTTFVWSEPSSEDEGGADQEPDQEPAAQPVLLTEQHAATNAVERKNLVDESPEIAQPFTSPDAISNGEVSRCGS
jgi:hypothetical protein